MKSTSSIKKNKVFKYVLKKGSYTNAKYITVHISKYNNNIKNYIGICVSKKNGIAVVRNRLKRWVREVYKIEEPKIKKGYNIVVLYRKNVIIDIVDFDKVKCDIIKCFKDLDLYE
jgi:ribonuclease P protein component